MLAAVGTAAAGTELWAQAGNTIINGSQLAVLVTPTFQACASNCSATPPCNSFNWCALRPKQHAVQLLSVEGLVGIACPTSLYWLRAH